MNRFIPLVLLLCWVGYSAEAQQIKGKEAKKLLQEGKLTAIALVLPDQFKPGAKLTLEAKLLFPNDRFALASEIKGFWEDARLSVNDSALQFSKDLVVEDGIVIDPGTSADYYPDKKLMVALKWGEVEAKKQLAPDFCTEQLVIEEAGAHGTDGVGGYKLAGGRGMDGKNGEPGPDMELWLSEAMIGEKQHVMIT